MDKSIMSKEAMAMKKAVTMLTVLFFVCSIAWAGGYRVITGDELKEMMNDGRDIVIVDVREPELFREGHIPGAINIPFDGAHKRILKELSPDDRIVFVCHGGPMGDELAEILVKNGYREVYNLRGGMRRWRGPLERE